ncbi:hypothetical protein V6N13_107183 [Hibiscus sabdariffa]|uniref:Uncharacterized protein n=1 Tax=Hibiscus sabdariffa TaxID=183260 RepID=A0ABR2F324_9ROSI
MRTWGRPSKGLALVIIDLGMVCVESGVVEDSQELDKSSDQFQGSTIHNDVEVVDIDVDDPIKVVDGVGIEWLTQHDSRNINGGEGSTADGGNGKGKASYCSVMAKAGPHEERVGKLFNKDEDEVIVS